MNRRTFMGGFVAGGLSAAIAEELSTRSIFLPPRGGWRTAAKFNPFPYCMDAVEARLVYVGTTDWRDVFGSPPEPIIQSSDYLGEGLQQALIKIANAVDSRGKRIAITPNRVWFPGRAW